MCACAVSRMCVVHNYTLTIRAAWQRGMLSNRVERRVRKTFSSDAAQREHFFCFHFFLTFHSLLFRASFASKLRVKTTDFPFVGLNIVTNTLREPESLCVQVWNFACIGSDGLHFSFLLLT